MVELKALTKRYGDIIAVDRVSLALDREETTVIWGPSGCGKTTLLRLIAGFESPDSGEILLNGQVVSQPGKMTPPNKRGIGMVFQDLALWPHMAVRDNIEFVLRTRHLPRKQRKEEVDDVLRRVNLARRGDCYPGELSGGERQRVALARAIVLEPKIMLMDEPLASLDPVLKEELGTMIKDLRKDLGMSIVYVTHDQAEAMMMADRIAAMNEGRIEQVGNAQELLVGPRIRSSSTSVTNCGDRSVKHS